ncbi:rod shape-determining protein MreC [Ammonifex degensii KC4]|uniref:Cell shape-determining protein MreC n=1 Tax=Ammonifex degensii (strain DSM 10501 / KC4) TaxID=429009 RepID=C9R8K5_AMMDK|nr:rod shape-determining protein MreC [Ammonifex degensii]ACX52634.1 rod shape-determining protein MreC [Ammonifex degensii KC4]
MPGWWRLVRKGLAVSLLLSLALALLRFTAPREGQATIPFSSWVWDGTAPLGAGLNLGAKKMAEGMAFLFSGGKENATVRELKARIAELEGEVARLREQAAENARLKALLDYKETQPSPSLVAEVVARNPDNWFGTLTINRGEADGVTPDAVVVAPAGLVGRVWRVSAHTSEVLLITDPRSAVGAVVYETRVPGIVRGVLAPGEMRMDYVVKDEPVKQGMLVMTSSLSSIFPPGIPVGRVARVEEGEGGLFRTIYLKPVVDLNRVQEVLVLLKK